MRTRCVNHREQSFFDFAQQHESLLAVVKPQVGFDASAVIKKSMSCVGKVESPLLKTRFAFVFIPFKVHLECRPMADLLQGQSTNIFSLEAISVGEL